MISTFLRRLTPFMTIAVLLVGVSLSAADTSNFSGKRIVVASHESFDRVNSNIQSLVAQNGMMIMAQVDQGKMLTMTGLHVRAHLYLVGNPVVGKKLFSADSGVGLYVPLRLSVYSAGGMTYIEYDQPSFLLGQFSNPQISMVGKMLDQKLNNLAEMASR